MLVRVYPLIGQQQLDHLYLPTIGCHHQRRLGIQRGIHLWMSQQRGDDLQMTFLDSNQQGPIFEARGYYLPTVKLEKETIER
jgi:hypothetical protein